MLRTFSFALTLIFFSASFHVVHSGPTTGDFPGTTLNASSDQGLSIDFELCGLSIQQDVVGDEMFDHFSIEGEGFTYEDGLPILPAVTRLVVVPPDAGIELVVQADEPRRIRSGRRPLICEDENYPATFSFSDARNRNLYPPEIARMSAPIVVRGVRLVAVTTYPVQYDRTDNSFLVRDHIETELRFTDADPVNPVRVPIRRNRSPKLLKLMSALAINGDQVGRDDPDRDREPDYVGHYLIVTHENCLEYIGDFIEWRRKSGWKVDILSLSGGQATNTNAVRNGIRERYDEYLDAGVDPFDEILLVGDRAGYRQGSGSPGWQLAAEPGTSVWVSPPHADYRYALLEGNDDNPDVGISRWCAGSANTLGLFLGRTLAYEAEPYMENTDWFTRGGVFSQHWGNVEGRAWHITIHSNVRWAEELLQHKGFEDVRFYEDYRYDRHGDRVGPFERDLFNDGSNIHLGRAENYFWRDGFQGVRDNVVFPIRIVASGHGEWPAWSIMRSDQAGPNHLRGAVATTCGWGGPVTMDMTTVWVECVNGMLINDLSLGWSRLQALLGPLMYIPRNNQSRYARTDFDVYGDPGVQPWIGVPRLVDTDVTQTITPRTRLIEVRVHDADVDTVAVEGAQVTLYAPGDMPDYDEDEYAGYDDMLMITRKSDVNGIVRFVLGDDIELVRGTGLYITVTGRDIRPHFDEFTIETPDLAIELDDFTLTEAEGNGDEDVNPGERFTLRISAANTGDEAAARNVSAQVTSLSPWVSVEGDEIVFDEIPAGHSAEGEGEVTLSISPACPDGASRPVTRPRLLVEFSLDELTWRSAIELSPAAPNIEVKRVVGSGVMDVGANDLDVELENVGGVTMPEFTARITSRGMAVQPVREFADYPEIEPGEDARIEGDLFRVAGNALVVPGLKAEMLLILSVGEEVVDTAFFELQVREPGRFTPQGPDSYGYVCYDDTDTDWPMAPEYDWIEISRRDGNRDFDGIALDFDGDSPHDIGETAVIELGFPTQFYGYEYDRVSITSNGFISFGDQPRINNHQNWPMDRALAGGVGMAAPFWDDLRLHDFSGVYYFNDDEAHRFIIEWYRMRHASGGGDTDLTFEVVIYDRRYWISETGDPQILFQYKSIRDVPNIRGGDQAWVNNTPYASVGISGPDGGGINYSFNNVRPVTSEPLTNRRAILFATSSQNFRSGFLHGYVTDAATGDSVADASVMTSYGYTAMTDEHGYWYINEALAERRFDITAGKVAYNDSTYADTILVDGDTLMLNFDLLHPEFLASTGRLSARIDPDHQLELNFNVVNHGNGPLDWSLTRRLPDSAEADPWDLRLSHFVGDSLNDSRIEGVVFLDSCFYLAGANRYGRNDEPNVIYVLNHEGVLVDTFPQPDTLAGNYGMKDLAWDGELIWGSGSTHIYGITPEGDLEAIFPGPYRPNQALAWDSDREILWISGITQGITGMSRDGEEVAHLDREGFRIYGLAYWPDDPDGYPLYIFINPPQGRQSVYKMNPDNGDTVFVINLGQAVEGNASGVFITNQFDVYSWVFMAIANDGAHDRVDMWQLDARRDWFRVFVGEGEERREPDHGRIDAGRIQDFSMLLNTAGLPEVLFEGFLVFDHNAEGQQSVIDVSMQVIGPVPPLPFDLIHPEDGAVMNANDSTEVTFIWDESIDENIDDEVSYEVWFIAGGDSACVASDTTALTADIIELADSLDLSIEQQWSLIWRVDALSGEDRVPSSERFTLNFVPNGVDLNLPAPVEFGLQSIYPSPFNAMTTVRFGIDRPERATLSVYDLGGRFVAALFDDCPAVGNHQVVWNAGRLPSGLYLVRLESAGRIETAKVALVK